MRKKVIIHIGASKAGSSSIQSFLRRNRFNFSAFGYIIPDTNMSVGGPVTGDHVFTLEALAKRRDAAGFRDRIDAIFAQSDPDAEGVIVSAENLSNTGNSSLISGLSDEYDVRIVMYLRRQDDLLTSAWQQWASKIESDFNAWLILALQQFGHWDSVLAEWEAQTSREAMVVRVFDRASFTNGDVVQDFVDAIGLGDRGDTFDFAQSDSNPSITDAVTAMVAGNRAIFTDVHDNRFYNALGNLTGRALVEKTRLSLLTQAQRDKITEYYRAGNEAVCRRYFPGRARLFPPVDHGKYRYLSADEMTDEKLRTIMTILSFLITRDD